MQTFEPKYINYKKRTWDSVGKYIIVILFLVVCGLLFQKFDLSVVLLFAGIISIIVLPFLLFEIFKKDKFFLKEITIDEKNIHIIYCKKDEVIINDAFSISEMRMKINYDFSDGGRSPRKYKLCIDKLTDGKFETIVKQYENNSWTKDLFKQVYATYCKIKNIPCDFSFMKTLFGTDY